MSFEFADGDDDVLTVTADASFHDLWASGGSLFLMFYPNSTGNAFGDYIAQTFDTATFDNGYEVKLNVVGATTMEFLFAVFRTSSGVGEWSTTNQVITEVQWNSIGIKYDGSNTTNDPTFYVNGSILTVGSGITEETPPTGASMATENDDLTFGNDPGFFSDLDGRIAYMTNWKTMLSDAQFASLHAGANPFGVSSTQPTIMYQDQTFNDWSGNANDLTNTGTVAASHPPIELIQNYL